MVNEMHKPQSEENLVLGERLVASNRQLQQMQEEHQQLIQEMEALRQRALELSNLNAQNSQTTNNVQLIQEENISTSSEEVTAEINTSSAQTINVTERSERIETTESNQSASADTEFEKNQEENSEIKPIEGNADTADYLQQKLNEIANLKAQYKRVQNMINTTKLIEDHLGKKNSDGVTTTTNDTQTHETRSSTDMVVNTIREQPTNYNSNQLSGQTVTTTKTITEAAASEATATSKATTANENSTNGVDENEELINAMMSLFTEFTSDLKGQAESLRAERDRIKSLKEEILSRRKQP